MSLDCRANRQIQCSKTSKKIYVGKATNFPPGSSQVVEIDNKVIGIFNIDGEFYALSNYCPHMGGSLCQGPVTGTTLPTKDYVYNYGKENEIVRCGWHGWEFDIKSGQTLFDPKIRAKTYQVILENGEVVVCI